MIDMEDLRQDILVLKTLKHRAYNLGVAIQANGKRLADIGAKLHRLRVEEEGARRHHGPEDKDGPDKRLDAPGHHSQESGGETVRPRPNPA